MKNDKCALCALKTIFDQGSVEKSGKIEKYFDTLRRLQKDKIIEAGYSRRVTASIGEGPEKDKSEMCAINSPFFSQENKDKPCPDFILNMEFSVAEGLSLNLSRKTFKLNSTISWWTKIIGVATIIVAIIAIIALVLRN